MTVLVQYNAIPMGLLKCHGERRVCQEVSAAPLGSREGGSPGKPRNDVALETGNAARRDASGVAAR
jgi:hypothetical protein